MTIGGETTVMPVSRHLRTTCAAAVPWAVIVVCPEATIAPAAAKMTVTRMHVVTSTTLMMLLCTAETRRTSGRKMRKKTKEKVDTSKSSTKTPIIALVLPSIIIATMTLGVEAKNAKALSSTAYPKISIR